MSRLHTVSIAAASLCAFLVPATAYAASSTYAQLYLRRVTEDPFTDPGYNESQSGTNLTSLSHTSPRGSVAQFTADAAAGQLRAFADAVNGNIAAGLGGDEAWALGHVSDSFTLNGPASGTPVSITARFTVDGTLSGTGGDPQTLESQENAFFATQFTILSHNDTYSRWARTETEMSDSWLQGGGSFNVPIHRETTFDLDIVAGVPFDIYYALDARGGWAYGGSGGQSDFGATGALSFDLPFGTTINSDGGFSQSNIPEPAASVLIGSSLFAAALRRRSR